MIALLQRVTQASVMVESQTIADRNEARAAGQGRPVCGFADRNEARAAGQGRPVCGFASIGPGLLVLLGVQPKDGEAQAQRMVERILGYRMFEDAAGKMNRSLLESQGELLLVPQFTLAADTRQGMRPGFSTAALPAQARIEFERVVALSKQYKLKVESGRFGADMQVSLINNGPVTFWLEVH